MIVLVVDLVSGLNGIAYLWEEKDHRYLYSLPSVNYPGACEEHRVS